MASIIISEDIKKIIKCRDIYYTSYKLFTAFRQYDSTSDLPFAKNRSINLTMATRLLYESIHHGVITKSTNFVRIF